MPPKAAETRRAVKDAQHSKDRLADVAVDVLHALYPSWTVDKLLTHPRKALSLCSEVSRRMGDGRLTDDYTHRICRALLNARKHGDLRRDRV